MCKLELVSVEVDTKKTYSSNDRFTFSITVNAMESIPDDVEFEAHYFGDAYSEHHDQKIGSALIGPFEQGKQRFDLETELIDFTKIPIKTLFGLTTILIVAKYKGQQFLRIGYVVNVGYPGVDQNVLADSDDKPLDFPEEESNPEEEEEEIEIMDDEELDEDEQPEGEDEESNEEDELVDGEEDELVDGEDEELADGEEDEPVDEDEQLVGEEMRAQVNLEDMLSEALRPKHNREPIPLETPIVADKDEFEYKGVSMSKSKIEMTLLERPIVHVFDINWSVGEKKDDLKESSEEDNGRSDVVTNESCPAEKRRQIDH